MRKLIIGCMAGFLAWLGWAAEARAIGTLTFTQTTTTGWSAYNTPTGADYSPTTAGSTLNKRFTAGTAAADAAVGGGSLMYSAVTSISSSGNASIDLTSVTDVLGGLTKTFARVKSIRIRVLSAADDATLGTAASGVTLDNTVANSLSAQSHSGWFDNANEGGATGGMGDATGSKFTFPNGCDFSFTLGGAAGIVVDGTHKVIKLVNLDAGLTAKVQVTVFGGLA